MREYVLWLQFEVPSIQYLVFRMRVVHCHLAFLFGHVVLAKSGVNCLLCVVVCVCEGCAFLLESCCVV